MTAEKIKLSKQAWDALHEAAKKLFAATPGLEQRWLDQCCTSVATHDVGWADLQTDYDWLPLFFAWHAEVEIPRECPAPRTPFHRSTVNA